MVKGTKNERVKVATICLILSTMLWVFFTSESDSIETYSIKNVPVEILNQQILEEQNLVLAPNQDLTIDLKFLARSNEKYKMKKENVKVYIDLEGYALRPGLNKIGVTIEEKPTPNSELRNSEVLLLEIELEELVQKDFTAVSQIDVGNNGNIISVNQILNPKVKVSGPNKLIEKIHQVVAYGDIKNISEDSIVEYPLKAIDSQGNEILGVNIEPKNVEVSIDLTEGKSVDVKVITKGALQEGLKLVSIMPKKEQVEIVGNAETLKDIIYVQTEEIDLSKIQESTTLSVNLYAGEGANIVAGEEVANVEIIVEKVQVTEEEISKIFNLPVNTVGIIDNLEVLLSNQEVKVEVVGLKKDIEKLSQNSLKATIDVSKHNKPGKYVVKPTIESDNENISFISEDVEFTISEIKETIQNQE